MGKEMATSLDLYVQQHKGKKTGYKIFGNNSIYKIERSGKGHLYYYTRKWKSKKEKDDFGVSGSCKRHVLVSETKLFGERA